MSDFAHGLSALIGNTPLIKLQGVSELTGCTILGKAEFMNPGGSVKDRTALGIIRAAEASGELKPDGTIVEGSAGNTGIGLTMLANALGYKSIVLMPDNMSQEKQDILELYGAELITVPAVPFDDEKHYIHRAEALANKLKARGESAIWAQQFDNPANTQIHYDTTGQEIWQQTDGKVDAFVCAAGTGGTIAGVSKALKEKNPAVQIALADTDGSAMSNYLNGKEGRSEGTSLAEGIGVSFITGNFKQADIDTSFTISDKEALPYIYKLLKEEGICLGGSSAINIAGAVKMANQMGPGHTIVTLLCDYGDRYRSKVYNPLVLERRGIDVPDWLV